MQQLHSAYASSQPLFAELEIETNKDLQLSIIFEGEEIKYKAIDWNEVANLYNILLKQSFDGIKEKIK
jgi:hypothetical protein